VTFSNYELNPTERTTDGTVFYAHGSFSAPLANLEAKRELGKGGGCPYLQSALYYREFVKNDKFKWVVTQCRLPMFLIYLAGVQACIVSSSMHYAD